MAGWKISCVAVIAAVGVCIVTSFDFSSSSQCDADMLGMLSGREMARIFGGAETQEGCEERSSTTCQGTPPPSCASGSGGTCTPDKTTAYSGQDSFMCGNDGISTMRDGYVQVECYLDDRAYTSLGISPKNDQECDTTDGKCKPKQGSLCVICELRAPAQYSPVSSCDCKDP